MDKDSTLTDISNDNLKFYLADEHFNKKKKS